MQTELVIFWLVLERATENYTTHW